MRLPLTLSLVLLASALFAERQPFSRYQSIIDKQMFGQPPEGFDPTKPASAVSAKDQRAEEAQLTKEQEKIKSAIRFSAINLTPDGATAVGFTDSSDSKNPVNYYLKVGESRNGWTVKEADAVKATMTIAKDDIEVTLSLGGNSAQGGAKKAEPSGGARMALFGRGSGGRSDVLGGNGSVASLRMRRLQREQVRQAEASRREEETRQAQAKADAEKAEREQREAEEKAVREKEREEQRQQLLQIQEELRKAREARVQEKTVEATTQEDNL